MRALAPEFSSRLVPRVRRAGRAGGGRSGGRGVGTVTRQAREEGRDFERHLVTR